MVAMRGLQERKPCILLAIEILRRAVYILLLIFCVEAFVVVIRAANRNSFNSGSRYTHFIKYFL